LKETNLKGQLLISLVVLLSIILLFVSFYFRPELGDEGILAMDGWRVYRGEIPQKDFFEFIPPLSAYIQSTFFKIFSVSVFSLRLLGLVYAILLILIVYVFYKKFIKNDVVISLSLSFLVPFGFCSWLFGSHHWLVAILQISGGILLLHSLNTKSKLYSVLSGILFGFSVFTLQDQGGYLIIGLIIGSFFIAIEERKIFIISSVSSILTFFFLCLPLAYATSVRQLFWDWVYFPLFHYKGAAGNKFTIENFINQILSSWSLEAIRVSPFYAISASLSETFIALTPFLSVLSMVYIIKKRVIDRTKVVLVTIFSLSFLFGAFHRLAITNLSWGFAALLPFYVLIENELKNGKKGQKVLVALSVAIFLTSNLVFAISRINHSLKVGDSYLVQSAAGKYRFFNPYTSESLSNFIKSIDNVPQNEPMFCIGYVPLINFLTNHPNPTPFNFILPGGYYSKEQIKLWIYSVESKKVEYGISEKKILNEEQGRMLLPNYEAVYSNDLFILWKRKE